MIGFIFQKELILTKQMHQKCDICHYWYFLDKNFKYESYLCNGCHDLWTAQQIKLPSPYIYKWEKQLIIKETNILNRPKDYYKSDKERLRDNARDEYKNLRRVKK